MSGISQSKTSFTGKRVGKEMARESGAGKGLMFYLLPSHALHPRQ